MLLSARRQPFFCVRVGLHLVKGASIGLCIAPLYFTYGLTWKCNLGLRRLQTAKRIAGMGDEVVGVHLTLELERRLERERHAGWEKQEKGGLR